MGALAPTSAKECGPRRSRTHKTRSTLGRATGTILTPSRSAGHGRTRGAGPIKMIRYRYQRRLGLGHSTPLCTSLTPIHAPWHGPDPRQIFRISVPTNMLYSLHAGSNGTLQSWTVHPPKGIRNSGRGVSSSRVESRAGLSWSVQACYSPAVSTTCERCYYAGGATCGVVSHDRTSA